jgi:hypothetical protein
VFDGCVRERGRVGETRSTSVHLRHVKHIRRSITSFSHTVKSNLDSLLIKHIAHSSGIRRLNLKLVTGFKMVTNNFVPFKYPLF